MDSEVIQAIQKQMNHERQNAQKYFYAAVSLKNMAYDGFSAFFEKQAQGELEHAAKFADFLISKRVAPVYDALDPVSVENKVPAFAEFALATEIGTTDRLVKLYALAEDAGEYQVCALLDWFLTEQIEEENWATDLVDQTHRTDATGWMLLDEQYK